MASALTLTKVAEFLYRNGHGTYFALLKVQGKQIKGSLKAEDSALARRRLAELRTKTHGLAGKEPDMSFDHLAKRAGLESTRRRRAMLPLTLFVNRAIRASP